MVKNYVPVGNEKFHQYGNDIHQGEVGYVTFVAHAYNYDNAKRITDKFNELINENYQLKKEIDTVNREYNELLKDTQNLISVDMDLNHDLKNERLRLWRLKNHLKNIGWQEEFIDDIINNTYNTLEINHDD